MCVNKGENDFMGFEPKSIKKSLTTIKQIYLYGQKKVEPNTTDN